jgi:hypothetical protein
MADSNYTRITAARIVTRTRRLMNQMGFTTESTETDSHIVGSPTTRFSDEELIDLINDGVRSIIQIAKASHVYPQIQTDTSLTPTKPVVRILRNRVFYSGDAGATYKRARRQLVDTRRRLAEPGRQATANYPIYTYEAGELKVYPTGGAVKWSYVTIPTPLDSSNPSSALTQPIPIDERFECALVHYVASLAYQKLQREDLHEMTYGVFLDEMAPYSPETVTGVIKDREVDVE